MLNDWELEKVAWSEFSHAYGTAEDIPGHLRSLSDPDPEVWVSALDALQWTICHQGTIYSASPVAVPFLIQTLQDETVKCRGGILELLSNLVRGSSYIEVHRHLAHLSKSLSTPEACAEMEIQLEWVNQTRRCIWDHCDAFVPLLNHEQVSVRIAAVRLLEVLHQYMGDQARPSESLQLYKYLSERLGREQAPLVRAGILLSLSKFYKTNSDVLKIIANNFSSSPSADERMASCLALSHISPAEISDDMETWLVDILEDWDVADQFFASGESMEARHHPLMKAYADAGHPIVEPAKEGSGEDIGADEDISFPWKEDGRLQFQIIRLLCRRLGRETEVKRGFRRALKETSKYTMESIAEPILGYYFEGKPIYAIPSDQFTDLQKEALLLLFENGCWKDPSSGNSTLSLTRLGLPKSPFKWEAILGLYKRPSTKDEALATLDRFVRTRMISQLGNEEAARFYANNAPQELHLNGIPDADLYAPLLSQYPNAVRLELADAGLTDVGLAVIPNLPNLKSLFIGKNPISAEGIRAVARFGKLEWLALNNTSADDRVVKEVITKLPQLKNLSLAFTKVSDATLPIAESMKNLEWISLLGTEVSDAGIESLRISRPDLDIHCK